MLMIDAAQLRPTALSLGTPPPHLDYLAKHNWPGLAVTPGVQEATRTSCDRSSSECLRASQTAAD